MGLVYIIPIIMTISLIFQIIFIYTKYIPNIIVLNKFKGCNFKTDVLGIIMGHIPLLGVTFYLIKYDELNAIDSYIKLRNTLIECNSCNLKYRAHQTNYKLKYISNFRKNAWTIDMNAQQCPYCESTNVDVSYLADNNYVPLAPLKNKYSLLLRLYGITFNNQELQKIITEKKIKNAKNKMHELKIVDEQLEAYNKLQETKLDKMLLEIERMKKEIKEMEENEINYTR